MDKKLLSLVGKLQNSDTKAHSFLSDHFSEIYEIYEGIRHLQNELEATKRDLAILQFPAPRIKMIVNIKEGQ